MIQALLNLSGQAFFNFLVMVIAALVELWPWFSDWWDSNDWRDLYFLAACGVLAAVVLLACHFGISVENCAAPVGADDVVTALEAVLLAFGLFQGARLFVRGGAYRVRAWLAR